MQGKNEEGYIGGISFKLGLLLDCCLFLSILATFVVWRQEQLIAQVIAPVIAKNAA